MRQKIKDILEKNYHTDGFDLGKATDELLSLHLSHKIKTDLLNWAKSQLQEETHVKLSKYDTPQRNDRIELLKTVIEWLK